MKIYLITSDNGDGSSSIEFWDEDITDLLEEDDPESYWGNEGSANWIEIPDGTPFEVSSYQNNVRKAAMYRWERALKNGLLDD